MTHTSVTRVATLLLALLLAVAPVALAQSTMVKGKVVDKDGKPMVGVQITVEFQGGVNRKLLWSEDGETWQCSDGCNACSCNDGKISSTLKRCIPDGGA